MKALFASLMLSAGFIMAASAHAQVPPDAPAGTTATCKDGSYFSGAKKNGACRGHKGVKAWYGATDAGTSTAAMPAPKSTKSKKAKEAAAAAAPTAAPAGSTGLCKDGTYYSGATKKGACRGHKGVKEWYGGAAAAMPSKSIPAMPMTPPAPATIPAAAAPRSSSMRSHTPPSAASRTAAPGGGAGQVWVNEESKVFHCPGDEWYGKTKKGEYMSEADAIAKGAHAAHGKACTR